MAESAKFTIGDEEHDVPAMCFLDLEELGDKIKVLGPDLPWMEYSHIVLEVVAHQLKVQYEDLAAKCTGKQAMGLALPMSELLRVSGFEFSGEAQAVPESPGTGTSTPPNSPPTESSEGISTQ
jgi:hypothetical protein